MHVTMALTFLLAVACGWCANVLSIDDFEYPDQASAARAWQAAEGSDPVQLMPHQSEGGQTALRMPCTFLREDLRRAVYDRKVELDLSGYGTIAFDFYCDDPAPVAHGTIYFHAQSGWYGARFEVRKGWHRVTLGRGAFKVEDEPAGWDQVDGIRICAWKADSRETYCGVDNLQARTESICVVAGSPAGAEAETARQVAERISGYLSSLGVPHDVISDEDVETGALIRHQLAIFGYNPSLSETAVAQVERYIGGGGKVLVFYTIPSRLASLLGVGNLVWKPDGGRGAFARVAFDPEALVGLPTAIRQDSWNINAPTGEGQTARRIGVWQSREGEPGDPAVLLGDNGAYMGHILTGGDEEAKRQFLLTLVGHFVPQAWETAATTALDRAGQVGRFGSQAELEEWLQARIPGTDHEAQVRARLAAAEAARQAATAVLADGRYPQVLEQAGLMHEALVEAYTLAHSSRDGEFRAVWNHSGTGDCGTWEEAMRRLAAANFNAVVPNMWWAGLAHYDSAYLPHSQTMLEQGDQIAQCVQAGHKYGIEVHPWKVNWNLSTAPREFVDQMRAQGRLQMTHTGQEIDWLCPSHPDNFRLELETMLEVVRKYDVDGVHFDYIRYPHEDSCYCPGCRERFEQQRGARVENWPDDCFAGPLRDEYRDWRCEQITRLVRTTAQEARRLKPHVRISAAVFGGYPQCRQSVGQDWVLWCKQGWLDFACPMNYTESDAGFRTLVTRQVGLVGGAVPLYSGIGQFILPDDRTIGQIEIARASGADGFILFNMGAGLADQTLPRLARGVTCGPAVLPHNAPVIKFRSDLDNGDPVVIVAADALAVTVQLVSLGAHRVEPRAASGILELQDLDGRSLGELTSLPALTHTVTVQVPRREGPFRIAAVGTMTFEDGTARRFVTRSRTYQFAAEQ